MSLLEFQLSIFLDALRIESVSTVVGISTRYKVHKKLKV